MRTYAERRASREKAIKHGQKLQKELGLRGGTLYEKHVTKIQAYPGIYNKGSISHYVATKPNIKSSGNGYKYGADKCVRASRRDTRQKK